MSRYFTRPRALWIEDEHYSPDPSPVALPSVPDHEETGTGPVDLHGDPIMRAPNPMGFGRDGEW